jgi:oligosaccharide repeat unit polymerase
MAYISIKNKPQLNYNLKKARTRGVYLILSLMFLSFILLYVCPIHYSKSFNNLSFILVIVSTFIFFKYSNKNNYLDFDTIFITIFFLVCFIFPVFLYDSRYPFIFFYGMEFDVNKINMGTVISVIGIQSYFIGSLSPKKRIILNKFINPINTKALRVITILLCILFIIFGGVAHFQNMYLGTTAKASNFIGQILVLLQAFAITGIATEFYNMKICQGYKISKIFILTIICVVLLMLFAGNRTFASQLLLPIVFLWSLYFKKINKKKVFIFFSISILLMWTVQKKRSGASIQIPDNPVTVISDLIIPIRSTYSSLEYVDRFGYSYGMTMSTNLIGIIPSLERLLTTNFGFTFDDFSSAGTLTRYTLGKTRTVGLGTTIIADIYLSFGILGIVICMYILGYFVKKTFYGSINLNYYSIISYTVMASFSVFLVRTSYTDPIKLLIWCYIIANLNKKLV